MTLTSPEDQETESFWTDSAANIFTAARSTSVLCSRMVLPKKD
jgi:hypothetical protein